jgi:hypothetical protein
VADANTDKVQLRGAGSVRREYSLTIQPLDENRVRFVQREVFKGLLVPLFARSLDNNTHRGFEEMNRALKERAEASPAEY